MSSAWSWYVTVLSLANILACVWLIRWTAKKRPGEGSAADTTGHEWDGLKEYNNPMPRWWLGLFYITIVFALGYLLLYPGLGNFKGLLGWTQVGAYEAEVEAVERDVAPLFAKYAALPIPELAKDPAAMATGRRLFVTNCSVCHGADGHGSRGFPNLADDNWQWGGSPEQIEQTITHGRTGMMMAWGTALGEDGVKAVATYVRSPAVTRATRYRSRPVRRNTRPSASPAMGPRARAIPCSARRISRTITGCTAAASKSSRPASATVARA